MPSVILVNKAGLEFPVSSVQSFIDAVYSRGALPKTGSVRDNYEALQQNGPAPVESGNSFVTLNDINSSTSPAGEALRAAFVPGAVYEYDRTTTSQTKRLHVILTADGTDIEDLIIEDVA